MSLLVAKILLMPVLLGTAVAAGQRWGDRAGGLILGLPLVSGPVSVLLFVEQGKRFALAAAHSALLGFVAGGVFCAIYASTSEKMPWYRALVASLAALIATAWVLEPLDLDWLRTALLVAATLALLAKTVRTERAHQPQRTPRKREVASQIGVASLVVLALTAGAGVLGSYLAGMMATVPVISAVLATSSIRRNGAGAANELLRSAVIGSWGGAAFFATVGVLLSVTNPLATYATAAAAALLGGTAGARLSS